MELFRAYNIQKVLSNTASQLGAKFLTSGTTLVVTILISYYLGLSAFGSFTKILTFVSVFYLIVDFGLNAEFIKQHYDHVNEQLARLIISRSLLALMLIIIVSLTTLVLPFDPLTQTGYSFAEKAGILVASLTILTFGINISLQAALQKELKYKLLIKPNLISSLVLLVGVLIGIGYHNLMVIIVSYVISSVVLAVSLFMIVHRHIPLQKNVSRVLPFARSLFRHSWPIGVILIFNLLYSKADAFMLAFYQPSFDVGIYGLAYRFFEFSIAIPAFVSNSLYPTLVEKANANVTLRRIVEKYIMLLIGAGIVLGLGIIICAPLLGFIKNDYLLSVTPLRILSLGLPFFFVTSLLQWFFIVKGHKKELLIVYALSLLLNVILNLFLIPSFSYNGAAYATTLSEALVCVWMMVRFSRWMR